MAVALDVNKMESNFATGHKSGDVRLWSLSSQKEINKASHLHSSQITCLKYTPDSTKIVTASRSDGIIVMSEREFEVLHRLEHAELSIPSGNCKFTISHDGKYVAIGSTSGILFIFNLALGDFVEAYDEKHTDAIIGVDWAPGSASTLATIDKNGFLFTWS